jgi:hypothetical protein
MGAQGTRTAAKGFNQNKLSQSSSGPSKALSGTTVKLTGAPKPEGSQPASTAPGAGTTPADADAASAAAEPPKASNNNAVVAKAPRSVWANKPQSVLQAAAVVKSTPSKATPSPPSPGVASTVANGTTETGYAASSSSAVSYATLGFAGKVPASPGTVSQAGTPVQRALSGTGVTSSETDVAVGVGVASSHTQSQVKPQHAKLQHRGFRATSEGAGSKTNSMNGSAAPKGVWAQGPKVWGKELAHEKIGTKSDP